MATMVTMVTLARIIPSMTLPEADFPCLYHRNFIGLLLLRLRLYHDVSPPPPPPHGSLRLNMLLAIRGDRHVTPSWMSADFIGLLVRPRAVTQFVLQPTTMI